VTIAYQSQSSSHAAASSVSQAYPASIVLGDFLLLVVFDQATPSTDPPAGGWLPCGTPIVGSGQILRAYSKTALGTESGTNQAVAWGSSVNYQVCIARFTVGAGTIGQVKNWQTNKTTGSGTAIAAAATAAPAGTMSVSMGGAYNGGVNDTVTESGSWTEICDLPQGSPLAGAAVAYLAGATPAACTFTFSTTNSGDLIAASFYILEAPSGNALFFGSL